MNQATGLLLPLFHTVWVSNCFKYDLSLQVFLWLAYAARLDFPEHCTVYSIQSNILNLFGFIVSCLPRVHAELKKSQFRTALSQKEGAESLATFFVCNILF